MSNLFYNRVFIETMRYKEIEDTERFKIVARYENDQQFETRLTPLSMYYILLVLQENINSS